MDGSNIYAAERILASKKSKSGTQLYLIKWKGYSKKNSTWEPRDNIIDAKLLEAFEEKEATFEPHAKRRKQQLNVFNPISEHKDLPVVEEVIYEPQLTKESIVVTDVTDKDLTVTISECITPEGFFH